MININTNDNILYTTVTQKVTEADFDELKPALEILLDKHPKLRWYYEMKNFDGWEVKTFFEDTEFSLSHKNDFEKIAIVGEKKWQEWMTHLMKPFTSAAIKYFDAEQKIDAQKWIEE